MPRAQIPFSVVAIALAVAAFAAPALAQQPPARAQAGMRYLSWPGRAEADAARPAAVTPPAPRSGVALRRPSPIIPHGGAAPSAQPAPLAAQPRQGLTPANAWLAPRPAASAPVMAAPSFSPTPAPEYLPEPRRTLVQPAPVPPYMSDAAGQPAPLQPEPSLAADPMAPRRDAPIFRMQQGAAAAPPPSAAPVAAEAQPGQTAQNAPAQQGAQYYSVHRQNGRQPDAIPLPAPFFLDSMPVDLAEPPAQPALMRNADGRVRAAPSVDEPDLP